MSHWSSRTSCDQEVVLVTTSDWGPSPKSDTGLVEVSLEGAPAGRLIGQDDAREFGSFKGNPT